MKFSPPSLSPFVARHLVVLTSLLIFLLHGLSVHRIGYLDQLDAWIYDARLVAYAPQTPDPNVVIVDIDQESLTTFGRWPWSHQTIADLITQLTKDQQVRIIGFNMVFPDAESPRADLALAEVARGQPVILGYYFSESQGEQTSGTLPPATLPSVLLNGQKLPVTEWSGYTANLPILMAATGQAGFFNLLSDNDGVIRAAPLLAQYQGNYYESLALALYRRYHAENGVLPPVTLNLFNNIVSGADETSTRLIPYRGKGGAQGGSFQYISAKEVLFGRLERQQLKDKVVLIGSSAPSLLDLHATPFGRGYPGVEVQANLFSTLLDGRVLYKSNYALAFDIAQLLLVGLLLIVLLPRLSALAAIVLSLGVMMGLWLMHDYLFISQRVVLPSAAAFALTLSAFLMHTSYGLFLEERRRRHLTRMFGSYVSPDWVRQMVSSSNDYSMQASNQVLTVMFCDMRGFTRLSQHLPPLQLQTLVNDIFTRLSLVIQASGGTIDKYMGDCVMAFWGAPEPQSDHAARAVRCAQELQAAIRAFNLQRDANTAEIVMGMGLHTGLMCVGDMGSTVRRSYTVIGDAVNLASRLEGLSKNYNTTLIVSAATKEAAESTHPHTWLWQDLGVTPISGSDQSIQIYTL